jgi:hypothetical protein
VEHPSSIGDVHRRDNLITDLHEALADGGRAVVQVLHGMGGIGKTLGSAGVVFYPPPGSRSCCRR